MKIGVEHRGMESEVARGYRDVFEQYNDDVQNLLNTSIKMLGTAKKQLNNVDLTVDSLKMDIDGIKNKISLSELEIQKRSADKEAGIADLIERIRQQRINDVFVYPASEIESLTNKYNHAHDESINGLPASPTYDEMLDSANVSLKFDIEKRDALAGIINDVGKSFDLTPVNNGDWCPSFKKMYLDVDTEVKSMNEYELMDKGKIDKDTKQVLHEYETKYGRLNIKKIYNTMLWLFLFPMGLICKRHVLQPPSITGFAGSIVGSIMNTKTRVITIASIVLMLIEYGVFVIEPMIGVVALTVFVVMLFGIFSQKRNIKKYSNNIITSYLYYNHITSEVENIVKSQYDKFIEKYRDDMRNDSEIYHAEILKMEEENKKLKDKVNREFDPDSVDQTALINEFNRELNAIRENITKLNAKKDSLQGKLVQAVSRQKQVKAEYDSVVSKVKDIFQNGLDCKTTNGFTNKNGEIRKFIYSIAYCNLFTIINGMHVKNAFGFSVNGVNISNPAITKEDMSGGMGDLAPKTIPIRFKEIDIKQIVSSMKIDISVSRILQNIIDSVADEFVQHMKSYSEYRDSGDLDTFNMHKIYMLSLAEHDYKCSLFLYNSRTDNNYVSTISRLIYERFFKATYLTAQPKAFRHHFMVKDTNYFNDGNIATLSKSAGVANDVIVDMMKTNVYDIVEKDKYSDLLKNVKKQGEEFRDKVAELNSANLLEYIIKCKAKGSAPYLCDYLYLWHDIDVLKSDTLIDILHETGGSKSAGAEVSSENKVGIIPFIFIDIAGLTEEKLDKQYLTNLKYIVESIAYDKFFEVGAGAVSLVKMDRKGLLNKIDEALLREESKM